MPFQAVEPLRLYRQIAGQIAALIDSGEFPVGSRLPAERELATLLGVSRTSVREAIISLEIGGRVDVRVGTGIFVAGNASRVPDAGDAGPGPFELLAARKLVEGEIAALAAKKPSAAHLAALSECVARMEAHLDDFTVREETDRAFHVGLARATGNGALIRVVEELWTQRAEMWRRTQQHFHTRGLAVRTLRRATPKARAARCIVTLRASSASSSATTKGRPGIRGPAQSASGPRHESKESAGREARPWL